MYNPSIQKKKKKEDKARGSNPLIMKNIRKLSYDHFDSIKVTKLKSKCVTKSVIATLELN